MELQITPFAMVLVSVFLPFFLLIMTGIRPSKTKNSNQKLPPGPWELPLIGNAHQLLGSLPHRSLAGLAKKHGPLMHLQLGEVSTVIVSSPQVAEEVMKTHDIDFANRPPLLGLKSASYDYANIVFSPYGSQWRQLRKICMMELLSTKRVQSFRTIREEEVWNLIRTISLHEGSPINLSDMIFSLTYGVTSRAAFGKKYQDKEAFAIVIMEISKLASGLTVSDMYPSSKLLQLISGMRRKLEKLHRKADEIVQTIIDEHRDRTSGNMQDEETKADFVDVLLKLQEQGDLEIPLSDNHIKAVITDIFGAGSETSSSTVEWAISNLLKNPRVMAKAQAEVRQVFKDKGNVDETRIEQLTFLKAVVKETLRLHPPVPLIPRESRTRTKVMEYDIPVKTKVLINTWAIGRDPMYWTEPDKFCPERFLDNSIDHKGTDFEFIPFGAGRRICPGMSFALPNIELPLAQLLYHFDWQLPNGMKHEELDLTEGYGLTNRRSRNVLVVPIPYPPSPVH